MSTLTDRYVWGVLRSVPESQRADLEPEIRALVADAIEAHAGDPANTSPKAMDEGPERAALLELGDPAALAARYLDRETFLIGPKVYGEWRRLLMLLLPTVVPIVGIVLAVVTYLGGGTIGEAIAAGIATSFNVAVQTIFWFTLVFAIIERTDASMLATRRGWTLDELPELPAAPRTGVGEMAGALAFSALAAVALIWQQVQSPIVIDGRAYPLFDPALWSFWMWWFLVVLALDAIFAVVRYLRGRWTWVTATVNALLAAAFAVPALWLLLTGRLFDPQLVAALDPSESWFRVTSSVITVVVGTIAGWDAIDGFLKAWRATRAPASVVGGH